MPEWYGPGRTSQMTARGVCVGCGQSASETLFDGAPCCGSCRRRTGYWYFLMQGGVACFILSDHVRSFAVYLSAIREGADATSKSWMRRMAADRLQLITEHY